MDNFDELINNAINEAHLKAAELEQQYEEEINYENHNVIESYKNYNLVIVESIYILGFLGLGIYMVKYKLWPNFYSYHEVQNDYFN